MKRSVARKWIKALESGDYRQVKNELKGKVSDKKCGYCCLGVLCDLYAEETGDGKFRTARNGGERAFVLEDGTQETGNLPRKVADWAGMKTKEGKLKAGVVYGKNDLGVDRVANSLITLNDDADFNFRKIAKVIRKQYADL